MALIAWQRRLLPFMTRSIVAMAVLFFVFSAVHLYHVSRFIDEAQGPNIREQVAAEIAKGNGGGQAVANALVLLEADALTKRYRQASALLLSRIWSRQMAFITGMVLAFMGAVFILGKLSDAAPSQIEGGAADWKVAVSSASPGIILSVLGTALLMTSLLVRTSLDVADGAAYLPSLPRQAAPADAAASANDSAPLDLGTLKQLDGVRPGR
jgi:hypothetical protein